MNNLFTGRGINEAYYKAIKTLYDRPDYVCEPRGLKIHEEIDATIEIKYPRRRILTYRHRHLSLKYLAGELAFYMSGSRSLKFISYYSKFWNKVSDDGRTVNSCYGYKLFKKRTKGVTQFEYAREQLLMDKDTRKAVMIIYTSENTKIGSRDNPCTMYLQFFIRDGKLILHTYMRSSDIWFGVSYDVPFFTILQEFMLVHLQDNNHYPSLELGSYYHHAGSLHLYEHNFDQAKQLMNDPCGFPQYEEMSPVTFDTLKLLEDFLKFEKEHRKGKLCSFNCDDPFIVELTSYLLKEELI